MANDHDVAHHRPGDDPEILTADLSYVPPGTCTAPIDLIFVLDESGSIEDDQWRQTLVFVDRMMSAYTGSARFGVVTYGDNPKSVFHLDNRATSNNYEKNRAARDKVWSIQRQGSCVVDREGVCRYRQLTYTGKALAYVESTMMRRRRYNGIQLVVVVVADGVAFDSVVKPAEAIRETGAVMFSIAVTENGLNKNDNSLHALASEPKNERM